MRTMRVLGKADSTRGRPLVNIGDGVAIPGDIEIHAEVNGYSVQMLASYAEESGRYEAHELVIRREEREIGGETLRTVPVARILRDGVLSALQAGVHPTSGPAPEGLAKQGPTDEALEWVARLYRLALLIGDAPTNAVADGLGVPRSTAGRWVTRARDRGLLTVADPRSSKLAPREV